MRKENKFVYLGTAIFILLAIALGIVMYMTTKTEVQIQNESKPIAQKQEMPENIESVTTEIGKTVEEQEKTMQNDTKVTEVETKAEPKEEAEPDTEKPEVTANSEKTEEPEVEVTESKKEITFIKPTEGEIICEYAKDNLVYSETLKEWITHTAIDIKADKTSVIKSAADGIVKSIINDPRYGLTVVIQHDDGYETVYSNLLTAEFVVEGEEVVQGQTIGTAGNTAAFESGMETHLHFELLKDGEYLDPAIYLK